MRALAVAAALALAHTLPWAAPVDEHSAPDSASPPPPALRSQVFQRSRATFDVRAEGELDAWSAASRRAADAGPLPAASLQDLARGTLLRAQLNDDTALTLRLRGGKVGLYLALRFP